jgi:integrase
VGKREIGSPAATIGSGSDNNLRKTFTSRLVQAGLPIFTVSKLIGHASVVTTTTHHAHLAPNHGSNAAVDILNKKGG